MRQRCAVDFQPPNSVPWLMYKVILILKRLNMGSWERRKYPMFILGLSKSGQGSLMPDAPEMLCLMWYPQGGEHNSSHWYYYFLLRKAERCWNQFVFWLPGGLGLVVCLCSWNGSQQQGRNLLHEVPGRLQLSCLTWTCNMLVGQLTTECRIQTELVKLYLLLLGVPWPSPWGPNDHRHRLSLSDWDCSAS